MLSATAVNEELLEIAIELAAGEKAGDERAKSWQNAILKGAALIEQNRCMFISPSILLILSDSGERYVTDGHECRSTNGLCLAFANSRPCKHRAAHRLMQLIREIKAAGA